jgi:hypothetical protein
MKEPLVARAPAGLQVAPETPVSVAVDPAEVLVFAAPEA